jgi:uncharacterized protein YggE
MQQESEGVHGQSLTVVGSGTAAAAPDVLVVTLGTETRAGTVAEALDSSVRPMTEMIATLRAGGADRVDLTTRSATVRQMWDGRGAVVGYSATQQLTARFHDLGGAGALVSAAVVAGGDSARLHSVSYEVSDNRAVQEQARARAWENAHAKASQLARLAGRTLGQVVRIRETNDAGPRPQGEVMLLAASAESAAPMPLEPGATTVTVAIEVEWAFLG